MRHDGSALAIAMFLSAGIGPVFAQQHEPPAARRITLQEAVDLALAHNHVVRLARLSVEEKDHAKERRRAATFHTCETTRLRST
jgi:hypothetical protein